MSYFRSFAAESHRKQPLETSAANESIPPTHTAVVSLQRHPLFVPSSPQHIPPPPLPLQTARPETQPRQPPSIRSPRAPGVAFVTTAPANASFSKSAPKAASSTPTARHSYRQAGGTAAGPPAVSAGLWTGTERRGLPGRTAEATASTATVGAEGVGRSSPTKSAPPRSFRPPSFRPRLPPGAATCCAGGAVVDFSSSARGSSNCSSTCKPAHTWRRKQRK